MENYFSTFKIEHYQEFMKKLMTDYEILVNQEPYRILEAELYYYSTGHEDDSVKDRDCGWGDFFFHNYGFDICFASSDFGCGGVLIRAIQDESGKKFCGPQNSCLEILGRNYQENNETILLLKLQESSNKLSGEILQTVRKKGECDKKYDDKPYRFIFENFHNEVMENAEFKNHKLIYKKLMETTREE